MIVRLNGGLGNQIWQYMFGRCVSAVRREELFFQQHEMGLGEVRAYSLDAFDFDIKFADGQGHSEYREKSLLYDPGVYTAPKDSFFIGCWQTEKYLNENIVRRELKLRNPVSDETNRVAEDIISGKSAFVHVRRTDYTDPGVQTVHGLMSLEYYCSGMDYIRERVENVRFFIFSDDPTWCRQQFPEHTIVGHNGVGSGDKGPSTEHEDLWLMAQCDHAIIANSSFSWWGAYWGDERRPRIVIAPQQWFRKADLRSEDIVPERWIHL